jgi:hypothetical protein
MRFLSMHNIKTYEKNDAFYGCQFVCPDFSSSRQIGPRISIKTCMTATPKCFEQNVLSVFSTFDYNCNIIRRQHEVLKTDL